MINIIRAIAASAILIALAFMPTTGSARGCGGDRDGAECQTSAASNPVQLDQFMKTWKPVAASKSGKRIRSVSRSHRSRSHSTITSERKSAGDMKVASESKAEVEPKTQTTEPASRSESAVAAAAAPTPAVETDGVAITSFNEVNELDQAAPRIQVVAFNEVNEIDLAAPPPSLPAAAETAGQAVSNTSEPVDNSWIGKLLLAAAGTIALAGGMRLLVT